MKHEFIKIEKYGALQIDQLLFETSYPILFTCKNEKEELFICVCCQNNEDGCKWLINKTSPQSILALLENKLSIRGIFLENKMGGISVFKCGQDIQIVQNDGNDWGEQSIFLPKAGEFLDADFGEFDEEIAYYKQCAMKNDISYEMMSLKVPLTPGFEPIDILVDRLIWSVKIIDVGSLQKRIMTYADVFKMQGEKDVVISHREETPSFEILSSLGNGMLDAA